MQQFKEVSQYLHFVDNTTLLKRDEPIFDHLQMVKGLLDMVWGCFKAVYSPYRCLLVAEAMIPFNPLPAIVPKGIFPQSCDNRAFWHDF